MKLFFVVFCVLDMKYLLFGVSFVCDIVSFLYFFFLMIKCCFFVIRFYINICEYGLFVYIVIVFSEFMINE